MKKRKSQRLVVYTALFGDKEPLGDPLAELPPDATTDLDIDFICFTDNRDLKSTVWKFQYLDGSLLPPEKFSRRPKALPHEYLPNYDTSLYVDNSVLLKRLPNSTDLHTDKPYLFRLFRHPTRTNIDEEADAIVLLRYEEESHICEQMEFYRRLRQDMAPTPLSTCTVILRNHLHPALVRFGIAWWEQILSFSKRDQLSFDLCAARTGAAVDHFPQKFQENDLFRWNSGGDALRIYPNFDGKRYAWMHRADSTAVASPRAHFLEHGAKDSPLHSRKTSLFEYICHKQQSSLGSYVPPRRRIATALGGMLAGRREVVGRMLVLRIDDPTCPTGFASAEHLPAAQALSTFLPKHQAQHFEMSRTSLAGAAAMFGTHIPHYELLVVLGHAPEDLLLLAPLIERLAAPTAASVVLIGSGPGDAGALARLSDDLAARVKTACRLSVAPSDHDELEQSMQNSVAVLEWQSPEPAPAECAPAER